MLAKTFLYLALASPSFGLITSYNRFAIPKASILCNIFFVDVIVSPMKISPGFSTIHSDPSYPFLQRCAAISSFIKVANRAELSQKEFQLEELEDREECETELWLNDDGTVTIGKSNGPKVKEYRGDWHILETATEEDRPFRMRLSRTYEAGW